MGERLVALLLLFGVASSAGQQGPKEHVYEPTQLAAGQRRPLLLFLHGFGDSGKQALTSRGLSAFGAMARVFVSAPDGSLDSRSRRFWNAGQACCDFDRKHIDDVARLNALLSRWRVHPHVDADKFYVVGYSNGGFMAHRLACESSERLAGIVSIAGAGVAAGMPCAPSQGLRVLHIHGDADPVVSYAGGKVFDSPALQRHPGARETLVAWGKRLGCEGSPKALGQLDLEPKIAGSETQVTGYANCKRGVAQLWTVRGGGHRVATGPRAMRAVWKFLREEPR